MAEKPVVTQGALKRNEVARPLHIQRLEAALDIRPFIYHIEKELNRDDGSDSASDSDGKSTENEMSKGDQLVHGVVTTREERRSDRLRLFNFSSVGQEREWLRRTLLSSSGSSDSSDENEDSPAAKDKYIKSMLKEHVLHKSYASKYYGNPDNARYMYYGSGLLSTADRYPEKAGARPSTRGRRGRPSERGARPPLRARRARQREAGQQAGGDAGGEVDGADWEDRLKFMKEEVENDGYRGYDYNSKAAARARKKAAAAKSPEALTARRRRHWQLMAKKELGKVQRARTAAHRDLALHRKRLAALCCKHWRHRAMQSQKNMKETIWRCKRLTREMQAYWRRYDRAERETRRRMEREAEEQRKMDVELMEAKRQRRKLNFLITQTELYAHFMQRKLVAGRGAPDSCLVGDGEADAILRQLDEDRDPRLATIDHYDSEQMKQKASHNAREALRVEQARAMQLDAGSGGSDDSEMAPRGDHPQPLIFQGTLKGYQLKGMNWLANLYDQGISGILADEMGLGKTVQCIAFLCHVAERLGVWGPFLVVSPASTLHNWQQEMERFVPEFKVVPYWGSPSERKILRQFWERKDLHTRTAAFHVVVTSYQIVVSDLKYLNRVAWQYMILDEAQAIKSSASLRWKLLLGFSCRNRLLLSGTPIQNSMAELWALLHFIMPTLFDSHDEFNEWFSKDIESHAENKTTIDEKHLSRLHMILKPFMLRRIKKDVENELSDKIEIMVHCPLTIRQKLLYIALKKKIKIEELLHYSVGGETGHSVDKNFTSNLMNLVMQFRKVCNHPELFERRDVKSSFAMSCDDYSVPKLVAEDGILLQSVPSRQHLLYNKLSLFAKEYVHRQLFGEGEETCSNGLFSFTRFMDLSPSEVYGITLCGWLFVLYHLRQTRDRYQKLHHRQLWWRKWHPSPSPVKLEPGEDTDPGPEYEGACDGVGSQELLLVCPGGDVLQEQAASGSVWDDFLFMRPVWPKVGGVTYTHTTHTIHYMAETTEHKAIRVRALAPRPTTRGVVQDDGLIIKSELIKTEDIKVEPSESSTPLPELADFPHVERPPITRECQPTSLPLFLYYPTIKIQSTSRCLYAPSRAAQYANVRHEHCGSTEGWQSMSELMDNAAHPAGWSNLVVPDKNQLVSDAGKLTVLDSLLRRLKARGHRVLIYSQMTKMIDLLEEYMWHRKHKYMRLDGSSKISARRDMVADFQARTDIFVFLLSTRAGGLGINLTAADTVIFYDSDWNPTVDQQAMDRAHRLGQTKQVTVYRLICKGTIEERIMQRAREKSEIQRMVISGGNFKPDTLKPKEVVSLLLDDEEIELKYNQRSEERPLMVESPRIPMEKERKRKLGFMTKLADGKRPREAPPAPDVAAAGSGAASGAESGPSSPAVVMDDDTSSEPLVVDVESPAGGSAQPVSFPSPYGTGLGAPRLSRRGSGRPGARRGRPRGSRHAASARRALDAVQPHSHSAAAAVAAGAALLESDEPLDTLPAGATPAPGPRIRRGPGRPRLRGGAAPARRSSGTRRPRRPREPLLVPLGAVPARAGPARPG